MPIFELYHQRKQTAERAGEPEVYVYDNIPGPLRTQIAQIAIDAIGPYWSSVPYETDTPPNNNKTWCELRRILCKELGQDTLIGRTNPSEDVLGLLKSTKDVDLCLSVIELICFVISKVLKDKVAAGSGARQEPDDALREINYRLRQAGLGYQFESGQILRVDSELLHQEVVKPALRLLSDARFQGAEEEYLCAHKHYREGNMKDAVTWANKSFESAMKAVCDMKNWPYEKGARAPDLLKVLQAHGLWPDYLDGSFDQLLATLKSGLPKVRNDGGAHGQGAVPKRTPDYVGAYALHLAAAKIKLIAEAALGPG
jgi:hypothetical protein